MVFLDTCIWIELCGVKSPATPKEIKQAKIASTLLRKLMTGKEKIVTCDEQLIEIISAVEKIKMKEFNRNAKKAGTKGCGALKEFRNKEEFSSAKQLCVTVVNDVKHFAEMQECNYSVDAILSKIDLADINDCMYYNYCKENDIELYTFDGDIINLGALGKVHVLS